MIDIHHISSYQITQSAQSSASVKALEKPLLAVRYVSKSQISCQLKSMESQLPSHKLQRASKIQGEYYLFQSSPLQNGHSKKLISSLKYSCQKSEAQTDQVEVIQAELLFSSGNGSVPRKSICSQKCAKPGTSSGSLKYPAEKRGFSTIFTHTKSHHLSVFFSSVVMNESCPKKKQNSASPLMINYNRMISCAIFFPVILRSDPPSHHSFRLLLRGHPELPLPGLPQCRSSTARASRSVASKLCSFLSNKNMTREFLKQSSPGPRATVAGNLGHLVSRQVIPR